MKTNWCHYFIRILLDLYMFRAHRPIFRRVGTAVHTTIGSYSICAALFACSVCTQSTRTERYRYWTNGCVNSCTNSPEYGPVGPKHVEIQQYTNKIVTSVGLHSINQLNIKHLTSSQDTWPPTGGLHATDANLLTARWIITWVFAGVTLCNASRTWLNYSLIWQHGYTLACFCCVSVESHSSTQGVQFKTTLPSVG